MSTRLEQPFPIFLQWAMSLSAWPSACAWVLISASLTFAAALILRSTHCFLCKHASGRTARHQSLNDVVSRAFAFAGIPATKKPSGLVRGDGKRPDGLALVPWQSGKSLTWEVTVIHTLADSYVSQTSRSTDAAAELASSRKSAKYADLLQSHLFQPIAVEPSGFMDFFTAIFFTDLGRKISSVSGEV